MRYTQVQTPRGTRDYLGAEAAEMRALDRELRRTFIRWGYQEVITPTIEFFEALSLGDGPDLSDQMFRFFDREGNTLALRPEMTTPIGRVVATRLRHAPKPLRLFYVANVFRYSDSPWGRMYEFRQAGVELVGSTALDADAEVAALALASMEAAGVRDFRLDIGHVDYFHGLLEDVGLHEEGRRAIRRALLRRDYVALDEALAGLPLGDDARQALQRLRRLRGNVRVLDEARALTSHPRALAALDALRTIVAILDDYGVADRVHIDLSMIKDLDYYTGMVLEGYTETLGFPLCSGGRYDNLIGRFGYPCPATGFALGIERVLAALAQQRAMGDGTGKASANGADPAPRWLVAAAAAARREALEAVRRLRAAGEAVEVDLDQRSAGELAAYAEARGIPAVVRYIDRENAPEIWAPEAMKRQWEELAAVDRRSRER